MSKRIVIIGGGFSGLHAATILAKQKRDYQIFLIDSRKEFVFTPWLIDALAGTKKPDEYTMRFADQAKRHGFTYIQGVAKNIDRDINTVNVSFEDQNRSIGYDCLLHCPGAKTAYYNIPGAIEHTLPLKTPNDVEAIHQKILALIKQKIAPQVAVVGAGPSGVESLFAIQAFTISACTKAKKPELAKQATFSLVQGAPQILPGFPHRMTDGVMRELGSQGFRTYLGEPVSEVTEDHIQTSKGTIIPTNVVLWCAGIEANIVPVEPAVMADRAGYAADRHLSLDSMIFVGGDAVHYSEANVVIPKNAQTAMPMGACLAKNAIRACEGLPLTSFRYRSLGNMISLIYTGFVEFKGFALKTRLAPFIRDLVYQIRYKQILG